MGIGRVTLIVFSIASIFSIGLTSTLVYGQNNSVFFNDNFVHAEWFSVPPPIFPFPPIPPDFFEFFSSSSLPLHPVTPTMTCDPGVCVFEVPNFIDNLITKIIEIHITFSGSPPTIPPTVTCFDPTVQEGSSPGFVVDGLPGPGPDQFTWVIECLPNPDWERIIIEREPTSIDTTALLLAGVQSISMWMIPVVAAGVGIGVFVIKRRK